MDLMATDTLAQRAPVGGGLIYRRLFFYSWFRTNGTAGVDVFSHNMNRMPGLLRTCSGHCFPQQPSLVRVVLARISKCEARAVIVVPNTRGSWFPMIEGAGVRSLSTNSVQGLGQPVPWGTPPARGRTVHVRPRRHASGRGRL